MASLTAILAPLALLAPGPSDPCEAAVGDVVAHTFQRPVENALGVERLEDLRGKPLLVEFWGVHCPPCVGGAVPASLELQELYGDDLQVLFVQVHDVERSQWEELVLRSKWLGGRAMWTDERPLYVAGSFIPKFALVSCDGELILKGNPLSRAGELHEAVANEVARRREGPETAPRSVRRAYLELHRGRGAKALAALREECADVAEGETASPGRLAAFRALSELEDRIGRELDRLGDLLARGYAVEVEQRLEELERSLRGDPVLGPRIEALAALLESRELRRELEAGRVVSRIERRLFEEGRLDERIAHELERVGRKYEGTAAAGRALARLEFARR